MSNDEATIKYSVASFYCRHVSILGSFLGAQQTSIAIDDYRNFVMASHVMKVVFDSCLLTEPMKVTVLRLTLKLGNAYFMQYKYITYRQSLLYYM